jgi:protein SCO1/2
MVPVSRRELAVGLLWLWSSACAAMMPAPAAAPGPRGPDAATGEGSPGAGGAAPLAGSLFDRPWVWSDERGAAVHFTQWRGTPLIVSFVYTACTTTCPLTVEKLRRLDQRFRGEGRAAEFVLVTLDPTADSAQELRRFKAARQLPQSWHLLRGSDDQTRALADFLGVRIMTMGDHIVHETTIVLLDPEGRLLGQLRG